MLCLGKYRLTSSLFDLLLPVFEPSLSSSYSCLSFGIIVLRFLIWERLNESSSAMSSHRLRGLLIDFLSYGPYILNIKLPLVSGFTVVLKAFRSAQNVFSGWLKTWTSTSQAKQPKTFSTDQPHRGCYVQNERPLLKTF